MSGRTFQTWLRIIELLRASSTCCLPHHRRAERCCWLPSPAVKNWMDIDLIADSVSAAEHCPSCSANSQHAM